MADVQPGQVWEDKDKRMRGRRVIVDVVVDEYAICHDVTGRAVRLLLRRMGSGSGTRGWRLVKEASDGAAD